MPHPLVTCIEREMEIRRAAYSKAVKSGRMDPKVARAEYDRMDAVLTFLRACDRRFSAEITYDKGDQGMKVLEDIAQGDAEARTIWFNWSSKEEAKEIAS